MYISCSDMTEHSENGVTSVCTWYAMSKVLRPYQTSAYLSIVTAPYLLTPFLRHLPSTTKQDPLGALRSRFI